jgi:AcrR family transcriptional regulator
MLSIGNAPVEDRILAAAASCVVDFGVERVTLAEIARRAGVSRPTVYRWTTCRYAAAAVRRWSIEWWRWPHGCGVTSW